MEDIKNNCRWYKDGDCGYFMPDSLLKCTGCEECSIYRKDKKMNNKLEGVGEDAEIVVNEKGGKQSKAVAALHLIDPDFLNDWFNNDETDSQVIKDITTFMKIGSKVCLVNAIFEAYCEEHPNDDSDEYNSLIEIGQVLQYGASRYAPNNWRLIPQEEHINHALIHYIAYRMGDNQDNHLQHCMCRLMMAYATEKSPNFEYGAYVA